MLSGIKKFWEIISKYFPDKLYLSIRFRVKIGKWINWKNPETYNEKLQWLKLYDRKPEYSIMVDKYDVKNYVKDRIGEKYIIPTIGVWNSFEEIDFNELPNQFVLKCTHDSGGIVICKDKSYFDINSARNIINKSLKKNYYYTGREWPYKNVKPRIIAEKYMEDKEDCELRDYKFFVFNGIPKAMYIATDRTDLSKDTCFDFYDMDFNHLDFRNGHPNTIKNLNKPDKFDEMKKLAGVLGEGIPQVRIDFYQVNGEIYFGEITFFHHSGFIPFDPEIWDKKIGEWVELPEQN